MNLLKIIFFLLVSCGLVGTVAYASPYIMVELEDEEQPTLVHAQVFEDHLYYTDYFYAGFPYETSLKLIAYSADGVEILRRDVYSPRMVLNYSVHIASLILQDNTTVLDEMAVSFCNQNGICEPCLANQSCRSGENTASCSDCPSGNRDNFCDLRDDGRCDPDCNGIDADCPSCGPCYYEYYERDRTLCIEDRRGTPCLPGEGCLNGTFVYSDDEGTLCCTGSCLNRSVTQAILSNGSIEQARETSETDQTESEENGVDTEFSSLLRPLLWVFLIVAVAGSIGILVHHFSFQKKGSGKNTIVQEEIIALRLRGYTDSQIKDILIREGHSLQEISQFLP